MEKTIENAPFKLGDQVVDGDGFRGTIYRIELWKGEDGIVSRWYEVYLTSGITIRFDNDLTLDTSPKTKLRTDRKKKAA
jgi:hypothetical protein